MQETFVHRPLTGDLVSAVYSPVILNSGYIIDEKDERERYIKRHCKVTDVKCQTVINLGKEHIVGSSMIPETFSVFEII